MRRISHKRSKRLTEVAAFRENLRLEIGKCEWCGKRFPVLHEISRGAARQASLDKRYAILGLCDPGCHQIVGGWPRAKQLMLLTYRRPRDYNLDLFNALVGGRRIFHEEVYAYEQEIRDACEDQLNRPVVWPLYDS